MRQNILDVPSPQLCRGQTTPVSFWKWRLNVQYGESCAPALSEVSGYPSRWSEKLRPTCIAAAAQEAGCSAGIFQAEWKRTPRHLISGESAPHHQLWSWQRSLSKHTSTGGRGRCSLTWSVIPSCPVHPHLVGNLSKYGATLELNWQ